MRITCSFSSLWQYMEPLVGLMPPLPCCQAAVLPGRLPRRWASRPAPRLPGRRAAGQATAPVGKEAGLNPCTAGTPALCLPAGAARRLPSTSAPHRMGAYRADRGSPPKNSRCLREAGAGAPPTSPILNQIMKFSTVPFCEILPDVIDRFCDGYITKLPRHSPCRIFKNVSFSMPKLG